MTLSSCLCICMKENTCFLLSSDNNFTIIHRHYLHIFNANITHVIYDMQNKRRDKKNVKINKTPNKTRRKRTKKKVK